MAKRAPLQFQPPAAFHGFADLCDLDRHMLLYATTDRARAFWNEHGDAFLREWIAEHPGTRPPWWWRLAAPREPFWVLGHVAAVGHFGTERRESEAAWLARTGHLTPPELEALARGDLTDEVLVMPCLMPRNGVAPVAAPTESYEVS